MIYKKKKKKKKSCSNRSLCHRWYKT